ncbi:MAG: hypothetical protein PHQ27_00840 [Victivallales bacterium]|nr:hypothetical protein [Victivallales bacterium]
MKHFYRWPEAVRYLYQQLEAARPRSGSGIVAETTPYGTRLHLSQQPEPTGESGYAGPFRVRLIYRDSIPTLLVDNGADPGNDYCGRVVCGAQQIDVPVFSIPLADNGNVILTISWSGEAEAPQYAAAITTAITTPQEYQDGVWTKVVVLGRYEMTEYDDEPVIRVVQYWTSGNLEVNDRWV